MTLPWEAAASPSVAGSRSPAEAMQPDVPLTAVATNTATGLQVGIDIGPQLRAAVQKAVDDAVAAHPIIGASVQKVAVNHDRADRTLMQSSVFDLTVAVVAGLVTFVSPDSHASGVLWLAAAVLASRTLIQAAIHRVIPEAA